MNDLLKLPVAFFETLSYNEITESKKQEIKNSVAKLGLLNLAICPLLQVYLHFKTK